MHPLIEFQYWAVNEFVKQVLEGNVISTIEDTNTDGLDVKVKEWIDKSYESDFDYSEDKELQKLTIEIFDQILLFKVNW